MKKNNKIIIGVLLGALLLLLGVQFFPSSSVEQKNTQGVPENQNTSIESTPTVRPVGEKIVTQKKENPPAILENTQSITLTAGSMLVHLQVAPNTIFYDALAQARKEKIVTFSEKEYPGLGFFVTDIGTLHQGNGKSLLYYINGKEATVGVSSYVLKDGDVIEWKLE